MTPLTYDERASALTKTLLADAERLPRRIPDARTATAPWKAIAVFAATVVVIGGAIAGVSIALRSGSSAQSAPAINNSSWTSFALKGVVGGLSDVSCANSSYCVAVDHDGHLWASTNPGGGPAAWKIIANSMTGVIVPRGKVGVTSVSCAGDPSRCEAIDQGVVDTHSGGGPGFAMRTIQNSGGGSVFNTIALGNNAFINRISCAGTLCVMVGGAQGHVPGEPTGPDVSGYVFASTVFNGIWANAAYGNGTELLGTSALTTVSCASASFCVAADTSGDVITSSHPGPIGSNPLRMTLDPSAWKVAHAVVPAPELVHGALMPVGNAVRGHHPAGRRRDIHRPDRWREGLEGHETRGCDDARQRLVRKPSLLRGRWRVGLGVRVPRPGGRVVFMDRDARDPAGLRGHRWSLVPESGILCCGRRR